MDLVARFLSARDRAEDPSGQCHNWFGLTRQGYRSGSFHDSQMHRSQSEGTAFLRGYQRRPRRNCGSLSPVTDVGVPPVHFRILRRELSRYLRRDDKSPRLHNTNRPFKDRQASTKPPRKFDDSNVNGKNQPEILASSQDKLEQCQTEATLSPWSQGDVGQGQTVFGGCRQIPRTSGTDFPKQSHNEHSRYQFPHFSRNETGQESSGNFSTSATYLHDPARNARVTDSGSSLDSIEDHYPDLRLVLIKPVATVDQNISEPIQRKETRPDTDYAVTSTSKAAGCSNGTVVDKANATARILGAERDLQMEDRNDVPFEDKAADEEGAAILHVDIALQTDDENKGQSETDGHTEITTERQVGFDSNALHGKEICVETFSRDDVAQHGSDNSCWIIIQDNVHDVTEFLSEHPAGCEILLEHAGCDASSAFIEVNHSQTATELLRQYFIGKLVEE